VPLAGATRNSAASSAEKRPELIVVEAPEFVSGVLPLRFLQGSHIVIIPAKTVSPSELVSLTPEFFAVADPEPSFDASKILFSAQKSRGETRPVWEMSTDGSGKRQITHFVQDWLRAAYLPGDEIVLTVASRELGRGKPRGEMGNCITRQAECDASTLGGFAPQQLTTWHIRMKH
jgi:hypothetical protein